MFSCIQNVRLSVTSMKYLCCQYHIHSYAKHPIYIVTVGELCWQLWGYGLGILSQSAADQKDNSSSLGKGEWDALRMLNDLFSQYTLFSGADNGWGMGRSGQSMDVTKDMKLLITELSRVNWVRLPSWGRRWKNTTIRGFYPSKVVLCLRNCS